MTPKEFVAAYKVYALETEKAIGISAKVILAQAALESGWGRHAPGNMMFGVKDTDGINGNEQLITTTEYSKRPDLKFPQVISVTAVIKNKIRMYLYKVKDYFKKYNSPAQSFSDHAMFFIKNTRYAAALKVKDDPYRFAEEIAKAGYATDPNYASTLKSVIKTIERVWW